MAQNQKETDVSSRLSAAVCLLSLGSLLILASFFPIGDYFAKSQWTNQDSAAYDRITTEYKRSTYRPITRSGLSNEEREAQREKMKQRITAMERRLQNARKQPEQWSRYLLWTGVSLAVIGGLLHTTRTSED